MPRVSNNFRISSAVSKLLDLRDGAERIFTRDKRAEASDLAQRAKPKLQNLSIDFNKKSDEAIEKALSLIKFDETSSLNMQLKADSNTIFNLEAALIFLNKIKNKYPDAPTTLTIRLDAKAQVDDLDEEELNQYFREVELPRLESRLDTKLQGNFDSNEAREALDAFLEKSKTRLRLIRQEASNAARESREAVLNDFEAGTSHFIEVVHNQAISDRSDIGIKHALKDLTKSGEDSYKFISVLNSNDYKGLCPPKERVTENLSALVDTLTYLSTGKTREPGALKKIQRIKYKKK